MFRAIQKRWTRLPLAVLLLLGLAGFAPAFAGTTHSEGGP